MGACIMSILSTLLAQMSMAYGAYRMEGIHGLDVESSSSDPPACACRQALHPDFAKELLPPARGLLRTSDHSRS